MVVNTTIEEKMRTAFIGHRKIFAKDIEERLAAAIQTEIERGCTAFTMGTHGEFDRLALSACRSLRQTHKELEIEVVITSLNAIKKDSEFAAAPYDDVKQLCSILRTRTSSNESL